MSFLRLILFFLLIYVVYHVVRLFIVNFRIGAHNKENLHGDRKPESRYKNVEEAEFTEIKKKDENIKK